MIHVSLEQCPAATEGKVLEICFPACLWRKWEHSVVFMAVLTKRAVCNYSAGSHLVSLQNKSVINEAVQNSYRNERKMRLHLTESSSHNRYCLIKIFPKLVLWVFFPFSRFQWHPSSCWGTATPFTGITVSTLQVPLQPRAHWWDWGWGSSTCSAQGVGTAQGHRATKAGAQEAWQPQRDTGKSVSYTGGSSWAGAAARAAKGSSCRTLTRIRCMREQWLFSFPLSPSFHHSASRGATPPP